VGTDRLAFERAIENLPNAYSWQRIVTDDSGNPVDYIFLYVNGAFEKMTGLKRENIIGRRATEVLPGIEKSEFDWIGVMAEVARGSGSLKFEQYSEPLGRWYAVQAYSDEPGFFTTVFNEITAVKQEKASIRELLTLTDKLIASDSSAFDYQAPVDSLLRLSGAKYAAINIYEENRTKTVTRAVAGLPGVVSIASSALGFEITGRAWEIIPERLSKIEGGKLTHFRNLHETAMGALNESTAFMLQELVGIGDIYVIELAYGGREPMGDIIFFMPKKKEIGNREAIELYAGQLALILARLRSEQDYKQKSDELDRYFDNSLDLLCVANTAGEFTRVSKSWEAILGYSAADLEGHPFLDFVHPEDMTATIEAIADLDAQREVVSFKNRYLCSDGSYRWIEWRSKPQGETIYAVARDVTEAMKAEAALILQKERLTNIVEAANIGTWEWNVQTGETIFNEIWAEIIGHTIEELAPVSIETWIKHTHPDDLVKSNRLLEEHFRGQSDFYNIEYRMKHKDGHWVWVNDRGKIISRTEDGKPQWVFGTHIDITERKKTEEALMLQARERAAVDTFTYSVSNDLQAPLRRIEGFSEALLDECPDQLNELARDYLNRIIAQIASMKALTDALLQLSKVVSHPVEREAVDLSAMARTHLNHLKHQNPERRVETAVIGELVAEGDADLLKVMLGNLFDNAWKFSSGKEDARIEFGSLVQAESTVYFIRDNGVGFDMTHAEKLFAPFHKLHNEEDYPGIGIGLNLVYRIISRHGGEVWADGKPDKGACFFFTLPD
jgi:PAS domain S-box-containing protein